MNIREKMNYIFTHEYDNKDEIIEVITAYEALERENAELKERLMSAEDMCLWCKHRGTDECDDTCDRFGNHEAMWGDE